MSLPRSISSDYLKEFARDWEQTANPLTSSYITENKFSTLLEQATSVLSNNVFVTATQSVDDKPTRMKMAEPSREEFDAKLATAEARAETRFTELLGQINLVLENTKRVSDEIKAVKSDIKDVRSEVKGDNKTTRITIVVTVIASILAGLGAFWEAQNNTLSAFEAGLSAIQAHQSTSPSSHSP